MRGLVRVNSDDHAHAPFRGALSGRATVGKPTSGPETGTTPLLSQTAASRRPRGKPRESQPEGGRRLTSQPDRRPTRRYEPGPVPTGTSHTCRRFRVTTLSLRSAHGSPTGTTTPRRSCDTRPPPRSRQPRRILRTNLRFRTRGEHHVVGAPAVSVVAEAAGGDVEFGRAYASSWPGLFARMVLTHGSRRPQLYRPRRCGSK